MAQVTAWAFATAMTLTATAAAQEWPTRPVTMVVPFTAGGPVDVAARLIAPRVSESLGQQIVVENMGGAGGMTSSNRVAKASPDGYLLVLGNGGTHAYNQSLYKKPLYNSESDFAPVGVVVENTKVLIVRNDFPANSLPGLSPTCRRTRPSCNTARRAPAPPRISLACCSITAWARASPMFPTAAPGRRCRT